MNCVLTSIKNAVFHSSPWPYYEIYNVLNHNLHEFICNFNFPENSDIINNPEKFCLPRKYDRIKTIVQKKEYKKTLSDNRHSCEINFTTSFCKTFQQAGEIFRLFTDPLLILFLEKLGNITLQDTYLRVQLIKDIKGYYIKPHTDAKKRFTMLLHFCTGTEANLGTDLYDITGKSVVKTSLFEENAGMFFFPSAQTWHGYNLKPINKQRISLMVNYFTGYPKNNDILDVDNMYYKI